MTLIEMEGFLRGKCLPGDMLVGETNAQYLLRKINAATELQRQLTAYEATVTNLEAEAKTLKAGVKHLGEKAQGLAVEAGLMRQLLPDYASCPNTDAALAEICAQGVDAFAADLGNAYQQLRAGSPQAEALKAVVFRAASFSEQLRKEQGK